MIIFSHGTITPISLISKLLQARTTLTIFLPISCTSPLTGANNTAIGYQAGYTGTNNITSGSNNLLLGYNAQASSATVSNEVTIGDANITKFRIPGINVILKDSTATEDYVLTVDANGEAGWEAAAGGAKQGVFYENSQTLSSNYTVTNGSNAMAAGPITISSGVTVTVGADETLTIV